MSFFKGPILRVNAIVFMLAVTEAGVQLLLPPFLKEGSISVSSVGYLVSLLAAGRLFSRAPGAYVYGLRLRGSALTLSVLLAAGTGAALALSPSTGLIGLIIFVHGLSYGLATTMLLALCMEIIRGGREMAGMMGWYTAFTSAGNSLGSLLAGFMADRLGMAASFTGLAVFAGAAALLVSLITWPDLAAPVEAAGDLRRPLKMNIRAAARSAGEALRGIPLPVYLAVGLAFYINFLNQLTNTYYPLWALQCGLALTLVGLLKSLNSAAGTLVRLFLGVILLKVNYRLLNNLCLVMLSLATGLLAFARYMPALTVIFLTLGSTRGVVRATSATYAAESTPANSRLKGMASGIYSAGLDLGNILGPAVGGIAVSLVGLGRVFWVMPALLLTPCLVLVLRAGRTEGLGIRH